MEATQIREALRTALLLSKAATKAHKLDIDGLGPVKIARNRAAIVDHHGSWKQVSSQNLEERVSELLSESLEEQLNRRIRELDFWT